MNHGGLYAQMQAQERRAKRVLNWAKAWGVVLCIAAAGLAIGSYFAS